MNDGLGDSLSVCLCNCSAASLLQQLNAEVVEQSLKTKDLDAFKPGDSVEVQV